MNKSDKNPPRLIAIAISHYCEKARWAMDYLDIDYIEEDHAPPSHRQYTSRHGGTTVPVLVTSDKALTDSHNILQYLDRISESRKLYPEDSELRDRVEEWEKLFDEKLGVATRNWAYYYAMQQPLKVAIAWGSKAPSIEKIKAIFAFPKIPQILKQFYNITPATKDAALQEIREIFALVSKELDSDRKYLVGNSLTAADLTFAALSSPILLPSNHPFYDSQLSKLSSERIATIEELRATPAGKLVMNMYREHRP